MIQVKNAIALRSIFLRYNATVNNTFCGYYKSGFDDGASTEEQTLHPPKDKPKNGLASIECKLETTLFPGDHSFYFCCPEKTCFSGSRTKESAFDELPPYSFKCD